MIGTSCRISDYPQVVGAAKLSDKRTKRIFGKCRIPDQNYLTRKDPMAVFYNHGVYSKIIEQRLLCVFHEANFTADRYFDLTGIVDFFFHPLGYIAGQ